MKMREEEAQLARGDYEACKEMAELLHSFTFEVQSCGRSGQEELDKAREKAKDVVKRLVNYL